MGISLFSIAKSGVGDDAYATAPDIDVSAGNNPEFVPDYYEVRSGATNGAEVVLSWDGKTDGVQLPTVANNGGFYVRVETHGQRVWVRRATAGAATAVALVSACTNV